MLNGYDVLQSVGSIGDALDNALAESFVDTLKTELIADRVWRARSQLELAIVEHLGGFNHDRLHESRATFLRASSRLYAHRAPLARIVHQAVVKCGDRWSGVLCESAGAGGCS